MAANKQLPTPPPRPRKDPFPKLFQIWPSKTATLPQLIDGIEKGQDEADPFALLAPTTDTHKRPVVLKIIYIPNSKIE